mmetsp:Transcript_72128/g.172284  ORF Transcript_72128/g.172284 Transcript_72128/m.172284 type:complete len:254 (+) Transcript_72128:793-1554(+)
MLPRQQLLQVAARGPQVRAAQQLHEGLEALLQALDAAVRLQVGQLHGAPLALLDGPEPLLSVQGQHQALQVLVRWGAQVRQAVVVELHEVRALRVLVQLQGEEGPKADLVQLDAVVGRQRTHGGVVARELHKALVAHSGGALIQMPPDLVRQVARCLRAIGSLHLALRVAKPAPLHFVANLPQHRLLLRSQLLSELVGQNRPVVGLLDHHLGVDVLGCHQSLQTIPSSQLWLLQALLQLVEQGDVFRVIFGRH